MGIEDYTLKYASRSEMQFLW